jgi:transposase InsO family protein
MGSRLIETGRPRTCNISIEESYPSTAPKLGDWRGAPGHSSCWVKKRSSTTAAPQASSSDAYPSPKAVAFFTNIIHRFGVPNSIITDNGTQFTGRKFLDFCEDHHIRVDWAAVAHPMTNGQVERANGMILQGLKPRIYNDLNKFGRRWMKEHPLVVWSLRTTPSRATSFTPFFLVYGAEVILPTNIEYGSPRTRAYDDRSNQASREDSLDQLEEAQDMVLLHSTRYQQSL